jgi:hypothetical protein
MALAPRGTRDLATEARVEIMDGYARAVVRLPTDCLYRATPSGEFRVEKIAQAAPHARRTTIR